MIGLLTLKDETHIVPKRR